MSTPNMRARLTTIIERSVMGRTATWGATIAVDAILPLIEEAVTAERERLIREVDTMESPFHDVRDTEAFWGAQAVIADTLRGGESE